MRLLGGRLGEIHDAQMTIMMTIACFMKVRLKEDPYNLFFLHYREPEECSSECETEAEEMEVLH